MSDKLINESFSRLNLSGILTCQYRIERIDHNQKRHYADLFNQYKISRGEPSEKAAIDFIGERLCNSEPVLFIVLTNNPKSMPVGFIQLHSKVRQ